VLLALATALWAIPATAQETKTAAWEFGIHGILLMNGFYNDAEVNNSDVPSQAIPPNGTVPQSSMGAAVRQTRVTGSADLAGFAGGDLHGELDVDFFGGQLGNGRTSPLLRIRRVIGELRWDRVSILVGQEGPLVADVNPFSLATLGVPGFAAAGNLWLWLPQIRAGFDFNGGDGVRVGIDAAALAPNSEGGAGTFSTTPNNAERSGRPMVESRLRIRWGGGGEIGGGGHLAWIVTPANELVESNAIVVTGIIPLGHALDLRGEWFTGQALGTLGGGGIGQNLDASGQPLKTTGGWGAITLRPSAHWEIGGGYGYDNPEETAADTATTFKQMNSQYNARLQWRAMPVVVAFEYRHFSTFWAGGIGEKTATHLNLAMGLEF